MSLSLVISLIALILLAALTWRQWQLGQEVVRLRLQANALALKVGSEAATLEGLVGGRAPVISIEILNPMEVAAKESWVAGALGNLSPALIRGIVYKQASEQLRQELTLRGIQSDVRVHHAT